MASAHAGWWALFRQWLRDPLRTAAVAPSSRELAEAMVAELPAGAQRVIELGGGTGALTRALLAHGLRGNCLLVVELNEELHEHLHERFPAVRVVLGDAAELRAIAQRCGFLAQGPADAVVSGLGLLAMPVQTQQQILEQAFAVLRPGGRFIQFTYGPQAPVGERIEAALGLRAHRGEFVLRNVPPATVYVYERAAEARASDAAAG